MRSASHVRHGGRLQGRDGACCRIALSPGLLLLDTPEAFQHAGGLEVLSKSIAEAAGGLGSQVMIATQSLEFLDILLKGLHRAREVNVSVTRFEHKDEGIVTYRPDFRATTPWKTAASLA